MSGYVYIYFQNEGETIRFPLSEAGAVNTTGALAWHIPVCSGHIQTALKKASGGHSVINMQNNLMSEFREVLELK